MRSTATSVCDRRDRLGFELALVATEVTRRHVDDVAVSYETVGGEDNRSRAGWRP